MTDPGHALGLHELSNYPRRARGSGQNIFRMLMWSLFRNFYSSKRSPRFSSRESIIEYAISKTREYFPGFVPEQA
jgi:hypothetical protein